MSNHNLPTLVLVPGSWHQASCYDKIVGQLRDKHHIKCISVTLPSTCNNPAATYKQDIDAVRNAISEETSHGRDVVVIAHSYGGMVGNSAIKGFAKKSPSSGSSKSNVESTDTGNLDGSTSSTGHVIGLILIASGFPLAGLAFMDPLFGRPPPAWRVNKETGYAEIVVSPQQFFYHDLKPEDADYHTSQLTNQSLKSLFEGGEHTYPGWMDVPSWYIGTVEDQGLPVVAQRMIVGMAREMGGNVEHRELQTSHSPFLSQPARVVAIILEAVAAFTDSSKLGSDRTGPTAVVASDDVATKAVLRPEVRLWQPQTWYRYGLPLSIGRVLGRGILVFGWIRRLFRSKL